MITKFQIRRNIAQRKFWKMFLINFIDSLINATIVSGVIYLLSLWKVTIIEIKKLLQKDGLMLTTHHHYNDSLIQQNDITHEQ
jgi:hypothetical protein